LRKRARWRWLAPSLLCAAFAAAAAPPPPATARIEARSADLLAVGVVRGERMSIRLSRLIDNAPVADAAVSLLLRGASYAAVAETDGSYSVQAPALALQGTAAVDIQVTDARGREDLKGTLDTTAAAPAEDRNGSRQLWWWVLNFAVCIGFLMLISRRRKASAARG
jgi:hypothetical protein